jgi:hypothetical protein
MGGRVLDRKRKGFERENSEDVGTKTTQIGLLNRENHPRGHNDSAGRS